MIGSGSIGGGSGGGGGVGGGGGGVGCDFARPSGASSGGGGIAGGGGTTSGGGDVPGGDVPGGGGTNLMPDGGGIVVGGGAASRWWPVRAAGKKNLNKFENVCSTRRHFAPRMSMQSRPLHVSAQHGATHVCPYTRQSCHTRARSTFTAWIDPLGPIPLYLGALVLGNILFRSSLKKAPP
jgi:hypothetical protein